MATVEEDWLVADRELTAGYPIASSLTGTSLHAGSSPIALGSITKVRMHGPVPFCTHTENTTSMLAGVIISGLTSAYNHPRLVAGHVGL
jgi:hypothetical protein